MTDLASSPFREQPSRSFRNWRNRLIANPKFQSWAARTPLVRRLVARDGARLFDVVGGFVTSQVLFACVELNLFEKLAEGAKTPADLAAGCRLSNERMELLLRAAVGADLLVLKSNTHFALSRLGAAFRGVSGLDEMVRHHSVLYRDLADPVAVLRGEVETELAHFWPYVFGAGEGAAPPDDVERYSNLMRDSQSLVAEETLQSVSLNDVSCLMDVGGGSGAFLQAVHKAYPKLDLVLFDLPQVVSAPVFSDPNLSVVAGNFRTDSLPQQADAISLVRVLYDHEQQTVRDLLGRVFAALPSGGRVIVSEPMSDHQKPERATDGYFAFYTMAMGTGKLRSQAEIADLLSDAGFLEVACARSQRGYVTRVVTGRKS